jgi:CRISPR-associated protein Csb2
MYVPNNSGDLMTAAWARGDTETSMAKFRVEKDVRPTSLNGDAIHFLFSLPDGTCPHFEIIQAAARSVTHLGWGIDMVAGNAEILSESEVEKLPGEVWRPSSDRSGTTLRVPRDGTLDNLLEKHQQFLGRLSAGGFKPVPPLSAFNVVAYRRATDPPPRPFAAFTLLKPDASGMRPFDTPPRTREVAGMLRSAVARIAKAQDWPEEKINVFVHGKTPNGQHPASGEISPDRFQYIPIPTINHALGRVESIRRVLVAAPSNCGQEIAWIRRCMSGEELTNDHGEPAALLTILPTSDWVLRQYVGESSVWSTVTPVILPGHDDNNFDKAEKLLRTAFMQAGYSKELLNRSVLEWRRVGFRAGVDLASRYPPPDNLNHHPRYHVHVTFPHPILGPLAVGSGRFRGFGLFAASDS